MQQLSISPVRQWFPDYEMPEAPGDVIVPDAANNSIALTADVRVDGRLMPKIFDIAAWFAALQQTRLAPLFTCTCGYFKCGGYNIAVERTPQAWVWHNRYQPYTETGFAARYGRPIPWEPIIRSLDTIVSPEGQPYYREAFTYSFAWPTVHALTSQLLAGIRDVAQRFQHAQIVSASGIDLAALVR